MRAPGETRNKEVRSFRTRLFIAIMVIVATLTALGFYLAQRRITADAERNLQETFKTELSSMHELEELRHATLADRCNALAGKPRIHAAIVIGFMPFQLEDKPTGMQRGIWVGGNLHLIALPPSALSSLNEKITRAATDCQSDQNYFRVEVGRAPQLLFYKRLNPGSLFPPAYEIFVHPIAPWTAQLNRLRWQIGGAGALLLLGGVVASHF